MDVKDMTGWPITSNLRCSKIYGRKERYLVVLERKIEGHARILSEFMKARARSTVVGQVCNTIGCSPKPKGRACH